MFQKWIRSIVLGSMVVFVSSFAFSDGDGWIVDFENAKTIAAKEKKDILMDFTGSDWCGYCIKLQEEVFSKDEFKKEAPKHFVLLKLDFPKDNSKQTKEEIAQNEKLQDQYQVNGFPTLFLVDAEGRPYAKTVGYGGDPAEAYMIHLLDLKKLREKRDDLFKKASSLQGIDKAKQIDEALSLFDSEMVLASYQKEVDQIIELDKENTAGLKSKYEEQKKIRDLKKKVAEIMKANGNNPAQAIEALDKLIQELKPEGALLIEILYPRSFMKYQLKDMKGAKADLEACLEADPDSLQAEQIKEILEQEFSEKETEEEKQ